MPKETIVRKNYQREIKYICIEQKPKLLTGYSVAITKIGRQSNLEKSVAVGGP